MLKQIKHKTPLEISYRVYKLLWSKYEAATFDPARESPAGFADPSSKDTFLETASRPQFFFNSERELTRTLYRRRFPDSLHATVERANRFLDLEFSFLGAQFHYDEKVDWHADPAGSKRYDKDFYQQIDIFSNDADKDIKHIWELNRHQYLIELSKIHFVTGDSRYSRRVVTLMDDWIQENPFNMGVNWTSGLEVAVRTYSWIWSFYYLLDSEEVDRDFISRFLSSLSQHGQYLENHLSFYFSPYNHLIGECSALFAVGYLFPELKSSKRWARKAWRILEQQIDKQFYRDGMCVEQASFYHYFTLGFYLMPVILRLQNGAEVSSDLLARLERILDFSLHMTKPDGTTPWIGDVDNARSIYFSNPEHWDFRSNLALGALLFDSSALKFAAAGDWEELLWLFGAAGLQKYDEIPSIPPNDMARSFDASGYLFARSSWHPDANYLSIDNGPIADGVFADETFSAAHGHADIFNFELSYHGHNFVVDPGFHNYKGGFDWHTYFRDTSGHNCLTIDGQGHAKHGDLIFWSKAATPRSILHVVQDRLIAHVGTHNAFEDLPGSPSHYRSFFFLNHEVLIVVDEVTGSGRHLVESFLHLAPDSSDSASSPGSIEEHSHGISSRHGEVSMYGWFGGDLAQREIRYGGSGPEDGWISPLYRHRRPGPVYRLHGHVPLPCSSYMLFAPTRCGRNPFLEDEAGQIKVTGESSSYEIAFSPDPPGSQSDGSVLEISYSNEAGHYALGLSARDNSRRLQFSRRTQEGSSIVHEELYRHD